MDCKFSQKKEGEKIAELEEKLKEANSKIAELTAANADKEGTIESLTNNAKSLWMTAKAEVDRKTRQIQEIRRE